MVWISWFLGIVANYAYVISFVSGLLSFSTHSKIDWDFVLGDICSHTFPPQRRRNLKSPHTPEHSIPHGREAG